jgi:hypothetical protein
LPRRCGQAREAQALHESVPRRLPAVLRA